MITNISTNQEIMDPIMKISLLFSIVFFLTGKKIMKTPINRNVTAMFTLKIFEVKKKIIPKLTIAIPIILVINNDFGFEDFSFKNVLDSVDTMFSFNESGINIISI